MSENLEKSNFSKEFSATGENEQPSRLSGVVFFLLCAILVFSVLAFSSVYNWAKGVNSFLIGLTAIFWLVDAWRKREFFFNTNLIQLPLLALISIGLIQLLPLRNPNFPVDLLSVPAVGSLSLAPYSTRFAVGELIVYFVFFAAAFVFINNQNRLRKIVLMIIIFGSGMAFFGILQHLSSPGTIYGMVITRDTIPFASFINVHPFASFMEMTIGLTLGLLLDQATQKNKRIFLVIAFIIMAIALIFTGSRGGMLSLLGVLGFIAAVRLLRKSKGEKLRASNNFLRNLLFIGGCLALVLVSLSAVIMLGGDRFLLRGIGLQNPNDVSNGRMDFWWGAWKIFLDHPILGAGLDAYGTAFTRYDTWNGTYRIEQSHNDYLQILADAGILGFACVAAFIFLLFKQSLQIIGVSSDRFRRGVAIGALAGCFGILIHSIFDFPLRIPSNAFFFLILTVLATASINPPQVSRKLRPRILTE